MRAIWGVGNCLVEEVSDGEVSCPESRVQEVPGRNDRPPKQAFFSSWPCYLSSPKRGCCKPAKLTGFFLIKSRISSKYPIFAIFSTGVDALPLEPKSPSSVCQTGRFTGLFEMQSCLHPHHTSHDLPYAEPGQIGHYSRPFPNSRSSSAPFRSYLACGCD